MMTDTTTPLAGATAAVAASALPAAYLEFDTLVLVVIAPIVAAWFAFAGMRLMAPGSLKGMVRQMAGMVCMGGAIGIVAVALISQFQPTDEIAALITLALAVAPLAVLRKLQDAGPMLLDEALDLAGLQRKQRDKADDDTC